MAKHRSRLMAPEFWHSESVAGLSYRQRLLFLGLISNADDQGRLKGHPRLVASQVFPFDDISTGEVQADLDAIAGINGITIYLSNTRQYIQIVKWWDFQHPKWSQQSELPPPEGWEDRWRYRDGNRVASHNWPKDPIVKPQPFSEKPLVRPEPFSEKPPYNYNHNMNHNDNGNMNDNDNPNGNGAGEVVVPPEEVECSIHHVKMPQRSNDKGKMWWSHKIDDVWCQGEPEDQWKKPETSKQRYAGTMPLMAQAMAQRMAEQEASDG